MKSILSPETETKSYCPPLLRETHESSFELGVRISSWSCSSSLTFRTPFLVTAFANITFIRVATEIRRPHFRLVLGEGKEFEIRLIRGLPGGEARLMVEAAPEGN